MSEPVDIHTCAKLTAVLSIGANLENARENLEAVFRSFSAETIARSKIYSTPPWGGVEQGDFLNAIVIVEVECTPMQLLQRCWQLEQAAGRVREIKWGPRSLDVDIVQIRVNGGALQTDAARMGAAQSSASTIHELVSNDPTLTLPHPYAHERAFVLVPWAEVEPEARLVGRRVVELIAALDHDEVAEVKVAP